MWPVRASTSISAVWNKPFPSSFSVVLFSCVHAAVSLHRYRERLYTRQACSVPRGRWMVCDDDVSWPGAPTWLVLVQGGCGAVWYEYYLTIGYVDERGGSSVHTCGHEGLRECIGPLTASSLWYGRAVCLSIHGRIHFHLLHNNSACCSGVQDFFGHRVGPGYVAADASSCNSGTQTATEVLLAGKPKRETGRRRPRPRPRPQQNRPTDHRIQQSRAMDV